MTVNANDTVERYEVDGTGPYAFSFRIFAKSDVTVFVAADAEAAGTVLTLDTDYSIADDSVNDEDGGELSLTSAAATLYDGYVLDIRSNTPLTQPTSITTQGPFSGSAIELAFDRIARQIQDVNRIAASSVHTPEYEPLSDMTLPSISERAEKWLRFTSSGLPEAAVGLDASATLSNDSIASTLHSLKRTAAEITAGVTPVDAAYPASPFIDPRRYHSGTIGNAADDLTAFNIGLTVLRVSGGTIIIPSEFSSSMTRPVLGLSNSQSGAVIDLRADRANSGNNGFGSVDIYVEGRDSGGNYASEVRALGKQNPAFTAVSLSDGTANGYTRTNYASSFLHKHNNQDQWQYLADPLFGGYYGWALIYFAGSTGKYAMDVRIDDNDKPRFTLAPANLTAATGNVSGATNATPIVIETSAPHGLDGVHQPVTIASVGGNTAANGDWEVTVLDSTHFELNGSVGNGAYTSGGTFSGQQGHSRATINVPKVQGGTEAIYTEGSIASELAHGTAPISVQSKTVDVNLHARPYLVNNSGTQQVNSSAGVGSAKTVIGRVALTAGAATVNLTNDAAFSSNTSYQVFLQPYAGGAVATPTLVSGAQFTIAGTGTDTIGYIAIGY